MEELYLLLAERATNIQEISKRGGQQSKTNDLDPIEPKPLLSTKSSEFQELNKFVNQMKRVEKVRVIKEDELIDMVFNLKAFDATQRQRFQDKSLEIMGNIHQDFHYKKPKANNDTKDIASLYLNFFFFTGMKNKVEDLKKVYIDNKLRGLPIISVLVKWLVELTRDQFKSSLKDITKDYEIIQPVVQKLEKISKLTSPKTKQLMASPQVQKTLRENTAEETAQDQLLITQKIMSDSPTGYMRMEKRRESIKENTLQLDNMVSAYVPLQKAVSPYSSVNSIPTLVKQTTIITQPAKKKDPIIQVYIRTPNYSKNLLDPLEDLDVTCQSIMTQWMGVHRAGKKLKGKDFVSIDIDRKKDAVSQVYKNLVNRNVDVERTVMSWKSKNHPKKIIAASHQHPTSVRKSENFWDDYQPETMKRFYQQVLESFPCTPDVPLKPKTIRKKLNPSAAKLMYNTSPYQTRRPSTSNTLRGSQTDLFASSVPLPDQLRKEASEPSTGQAKQTRPETRPTRLADTAEIDYGLSDTKIVSKAEAVASENHFRILKVTKFIHKVTPQTKKAPSKSRKGEKSQNEHSAMTPNIAKMLERIYTNPIKTNPSERSLSPPNDKQHSMQAVDPSYLKRPSYADESSLYDRSTSLFTIKGKYSQPTLHIDFNKRPSMNEGTTEVKSTKNFQEVFGKFSEMLIQRESSKAIGQSGVTSLDNDVMPNPGLYARDRSLELDENHKVIVVKHNQPYALKNGAFLPYGEGKKGKREENSEIKDQKGEHKKMTRLRKFVSPSFSQVNKNS